MQAHHAPSPSIARRASRHEARLQSLSSDSVDQPLKLHNSSAASASTGAGGGDKTALAGISKSKSSRRYGARSYYSTYQSQDGLDRVGDDEDGDDDKGLFDQDENDRNTPAPALGYKMKEYSIESITSETAVDTRSGTSRHSRAESIEVEVTTESEQNLDLLLNSIGGSGIKARGNLSAEKYLVQSFMSTSTITPAGDTALQRAGKLDSGDGKWQQKFGSLGLISADEKVILLFSIIFLIPRVDVMYVFFFK